MQEYDEKNPATYKGQNLHTMTMSALYTYFGLDAQTIDFIGHSLALHRDEAYLNEPALPTVMKIKLYHDSLSRYDGLTSPYIYPRYGLGELPQVSLRAEYPGRKWQIHIVGPLCTTAQGSGGEQFALPSSLTQARHADTLGRKDWGLDAYRQNTM